MQQVCLHIAFGLQGCHDVIVPGLLYHQVVHDDRPLLPLPV